MNIDKYNADIFTGLVAIAAYSIFSYFVPPFRWLGVIMAAVLAMFIRRWFAWYSRELEKEKNG